jgi:hypothetical protein
MRLQLNIEEEKMKKSRRKENKKRGEDTKKKGESRYDSIAGEKMA